MGRTRLILGSVLLLLGSLACTITLPSLPSVRLTRLEVGPLQEYEETVPASGVTEADVTVHFGSGDISLTAGEPDVLFSGHFQTNVEEWAPEVTWEGGDLVIEQGHESGMPDPGAENNWDLAFAPGVALDMDIGIGASDGELDFTGLSLTNLLLETGASDMMVRFDAPNPAQMERMTIRAGAASLRVDGIGNAGPERLDVDGGVGNIILDFSGVWSHSAQASVTAGTGAVLLRLPRDVGVQVKVEGGLGSVDVGEELTLSDGAYVNQAYGEAETELLIEVTVGVGNLELELVGE